MRSATIEKPRVWTRRPNLENYAEACRSFSWEGVRREMDGLPGGRGLNIAHEAVDRHAAGPARDRLALRWLGKDGSRRDLTFGNLRDLSSTSIRSTFSTC